MSFRKVDVKTEVGIHFCSGVLITEENVLSTGRCLKRASLIIYPLYDDVFVLTTRTNLWHPRRKILIKHIEVHQNYSEQRDSDDIAVVTVSFTLYFMHYIFHTMMIFLKFISNPFSCFDLCPLVITYTERNPISWAD